MRKILSIGLVFGCLSCEMVVDIEVPYSGEDLVVNSIFNPDSVWIARVTVNRPILDTSPYKRIENALVVVYEDGNAVDTLTNTGQDMGLYRSDTGKPVIGKNYELRASAQSFDPVNGFSHVPIPVEILDVSHVTIPTDDYVPLTTFKIKFQDPPQQKNYYDIVVKSRVRHSYYWASFEGTDPAVGFSAYRDYSHFFVRDVLFDGKETTLSFESYDLFEANEVIIILRSITEEYFRYEETLRLQQDIGDDPLSQPINVYNNIGGGFGIFAGYSQSSFVYYNEVPLVTSISPLEGRAGDHIMIMGEHLTPTVPGDIVVAFTGFGQTKGEIVQATDEFIEAIVPSGAQTGGIYVYINGRLANERHIFEVIP